MSLVICRSARASGQEIVLGPYQIAGAANVQISGINDSGIAVGTFWSENYHSPVGFLGRSGNTTRLQNPDRVPGATASPVPTSINDNGFVAGTYQSDTVHGFVWFSGKYLLDFSLGYHPSKLPPPIIANGNRIGYNFSVGSNISYVFAGAMASPSHLELGGFAVLDSLNSRNEVAGQYQWFVGDRPVNAVFLAGPSDVKTILPHGAMASFGGYLNESGKVAGSFVDSNGTYKGFVYFEGSYQTFAMPSGLLDLSVQGIDSSGSVIGTYKDSRGQHAFVFETGGLMTFGSWSTGDVVKVSISPLGVWIAVSVQTIQGSKSRAFVAKCNC